MATLGKNLKFAVESDLLKRIGCGGGGAGGGAGVGSAVRRRQRRQRHGRPVSARPDALAQRPQRHARVHHLLTQLLETDHKIHLKIHLKIQKLPVNSNGKRCWLYDSAARRWATCRREDRRTRCRRSRCRPGWTDVNGDWKLILHRKRPIRDRNWWLISPFPSATSGRARCCCWKVAKSTPAAR